MEEQTILLAAPQNEESYTPPKATFVGLDLAPNQDELVQGRDKKGTYAVPVGCC